MTIYDGIMLGLVIAGMIWGAWRGITWQVASLASLILGYLVAFPAAGPLTRQIHFPGNETMQWGLALMTAYAAVSCGVFLISWTIRTTLRKLKFEAYDRHLGMVLGGLEGAVIGVVATVFVVSLAPSTRQPVLTSPSGRVVSKTLSLAQAALPERVRETLRPFWETAHSNGLVASEGNGDEEFPRLAIELPETPDRLAREAPDTEDGSILGDILEKQGARIGRVLSEAVETQASKTSDGRNPQRR